MGCDLAVHTPEWKGRPAGWGRAAARRVETHLVHLLPQPGHLSLQLLLQAPTGPLQAPALSPNQLQLLPGAHLLPLQHLLLFPKLVPLLLQLPAGVQKGLCPGPCTTHPRPPWSAQPCPRLPSLRPSQGCQVPSSLCGPCPPQTCSVQKWKR